MIEHFLHFLRSSNLRDLSPKTILDLGCCTGEQSIELAAAYPDAIVHAFECSPDALPIAAEAFSQSSLENRLRLHSWAVDSKSGHRDFWIADPSINMGASSFYRSTGHEVLQPLNQRQAVVSSVRLDEWARKHNIEGIELVWADLQGAELSALQGMGELLATVQAAHVEVCFKELYDGQPLIEDVREFMESQGLRMWVVIHDVNKYFGDAIFIRPDSIGSNGEHNQDKFNG